MNALGRLLRAPNLHCSSPSYSKQFTLPGCHNHRMYYSTVLFFRSPGVILHNVVISLVDPSIQLIKIKPGTEAYLGCMGVGVGRAWWGAANEKKPKHFQPPSLSPCAHLTQKRRGHRGQGGGAKGHVDAGGNIMISSHPRPARQDQVAITLAG